MGCINSEQVSNILQCDTTTADHSKVEMSGKVPLEAHRIIKFITSAMYRHGMILTESNRHHLEQWTELIARFYLYDTTSTERRSTYRLMRRHHTKVWKNIEAIIRFELLVRNTKKPSTKIDAFEEELQADWMSLTNALRTNV